MRRTGDQKWQYLFPNLPFLGSLSLNSLLLNSLTLLLPWIRGIVGLALIGIIFMGAMGAVWLERKLSADIQTRVGPCRVGKYGLLQLVADAIKLFTKEDLRPLNADSLLFNNANIFMMGSVFLMLVAIPVGAIIFNGVEYPIAVTQMDISVLYIEAMSAISIFGIFMIAYGSNNKYSLLGAFRNFARMVGYEVPLRAKCRKCGSYDRFLKHCGNLKSPGLALEYLPAAHRFFRFFCFSYGRYGEASL